MIKKITLSQHEDILKFLKIHLYIYMYAYMYIRSEKNFLLVIEMNFIKHVYIWSNPNNKVSLMS